MRLLTWNLWRHHGQWRVRRPAIEATLDELEPDVCLLQEVWCDAVLSRWPVVASATLRLPADSATHCSQVAALVPFVASRPGDHLPVVGGDFNDYVLVGFTGGPRRVRRVEVVAARPVAGVWSSDHAGVLVELDLEGHRHA